MADTQHTPVPWTIDHERIGPPGEPVALLCDTTATESGTVVEWPRIDGEVVDDTANEANAEFIIRACNSHDALLSALEMALRMMEGEGLDEQFDGEAEVIRDAIAKAKGVDQKGMSD